MEGLCRNVSQLRSRRLLKMKSRDTRKEILDATQRLIQAEGIMRLTTREIAREAKCAEGTLFKYFKRKEDICLAVVVENAPKFREAIDRVKPGESTVAKNLFLIGSAAVDFFEKLIPLSVSLFADIELLARHREEMAREGRGPQDVFELIAGYIEAEKQFARIDTRASSLSVAAALLGPCFQRVFIRQAMGRVLPPVGDEPFVSLLVETLMLGLTPRDIRKEHQRRVR